jgi:mycothiol synthase
MSRPQLRMSMIDFSNLPPVDTPPPYQLRTYRPGDEQPWADIMNSTGQMGSWTADKVSEHMTTSPRFIPEGMFFAIFNGDPISTACAFLDDPANHDVIQLHMVATKPEHQGKGLAKVCSLAVVHFCAHLGFTEVYLRTDDYRLPALKMYLKMGFDPSYVEGAGEDRWAEVRRTLGM